VIWSAFALVLPQVFRGVARRVASGTARAAIHRDGNFLIAEQFESTPTTGAIVTRTDVRLGGGQWRLTLIRAGI